MVSKSLVVLCGEQATQPVVNTGTLYQRRATIGTAVTERKSVLLRLDPAVHDALARWASDEMRSTNAQIEFLLRRALAQAGRLSCRPGPMRPGDGHPPPAGPEPARHRTATTRPGDPHALEAAQKCRRSGDGRRVLAADGHDVAGCLV